MERWSRRILIVACGLLGAALIAAIAVEVHSTWLLPEAPRDRNASQQSRIEAPEGSFSFAVFGDNKNSLRTFDLLRDKIDEDDVAFAIDIGDLVFDGETIKHRLFLNQVARMKTPLLCALGNHDIEAGGLGEYERIYGPRYYSFNAGGSYFIVLDDSDQRSVDSEQMSWLKRELRKSLDYSHRFVFLHVPPYRGDRNPTMPMSEFLTDRKNAAEIKQLCVDHYVDCLFASHMHTFDEDMWPWDVHYIITGGGGAELWDVDKYRDMHHYVRVTVKGGRVEYKVRPVTSVGSTFLYKHYDEPFVYAYAYIANNFWLVLGCLLGGLGAALGVLFLISRRKEEPAT